MTTTSRRPSVAIRVFHNEANVPTLMRRAMAGLDHVTGDVVAVMDGDLQICYHLFYRLINRLSSLHVPRSAGDFSIMSRRVVEVIRRASALCARALARLAFDGIFAFSTPVCGGSS